MAKAKSKRLVRGKDWHGWALKYNDSNELSSWAPFCKGGPVDVGKWVKVRFVEVKGKCRG